MHSLQHARLSLSPHANDIAHHIETWTKPQPRYMKINVDAAVNLSRQKMGFGCLVCDKLGHFIVAKNIMQLGVYKPKVAKVLAACEALSWTKNLRCNLMHVEVDVLQIVKDFHNSSSSPYSISSMILNDVKEISKDYTHVFFSFARRSTNRVVHTLVQQVVLQADCGE